MPFIGHKNFLHPRKIQTRFVGLSICIALKTYKYLNANVRAFLWFALLNITRKNDIARYGENNMLWAQSLWDAKMD